MSTASLDPKIVRKAGEGFDRPSAQAELPIDINYQKLSEWLVQRQKLPADWHKRLQAIQSKIAEAVKELPAGLLAGLLGDADTTVDYFAALRIRDKLAETGERTLFGGLTGQAGVWDKIVRAYENGGVFIGEAAQTMVQYVDYEIPYLRKQMSKCTQQMADADRRHAEYTRSADSCAANYKKECEKMGIAGHAVGQELRQLTNQLPGLFNQLVADLRSPEVDHVIHYYKHFTQYAHGSNNNSSKVPTQQEAKQQQLPDVLHTLVEVREQRTVPYSSSAAADNNAAGAAVAPVSMVQWGSLIDPGLIYSSGVAPAEIDWGIGAGTPAQAEDAHAATGGISWDLGDAAETTAEGDGAGISWDVAVEPEAQGSEAAAAPAGGGPTLDWDIDISGIGVEDAGDSAAAAAPAIQWDVDVGAGADADPDAGTAPSAMADGGSGAAGSSSGDASADRLQHDSDYRSQLLDDLQELRAFLISRRAELSGSSSSSNLLRALAPDVVSAVDAGDVGKMLEVVDCLLAALNDEKLKQLLMMSNSNRYMERLQNSLLRKAGQQAKMLTAAAETQARKHEARATLATLQPKLSELLEHIRSIKKLVEAALSKQFNGRQVNVLGEINNALAGAA